MTRTVAGLMAVDTVKSIRPPLTWSRFPAASTSRSRGRGRNLSLVMALTISVPGDPTVPGVKVALVIVTISGTLTRVRKGLAASVRLLTVSGSKGCLRVKGMEIM